MSLSEDFYGIPESNPGLYALPRHRSNRPTLGLKGRSKWDSSWKTSLVTLTETMLTSASSNWEGGWCWIGRNCVRRAASSIWAAEQGLCLLPGLSTHFGHSVGIDISQEMLNVAASKSIRNVEWRLEDVSRGSWKGGRHATVLSEGYSFPTGDSPAKLLIAQTVRALAPGGFALFDFLSGEAPEATKILAPNRCVLSRLAHRPSEALGI